MSSDRSLLKDLGLKAISITVFHIRDNIHNINRIRSGRFPETQSLIVFFIFFNWHTIDMINLAPGVQHSDSAITYIMKCSPLCVCDYRLYPYNVVTILLNIFPILDFFTLVTYFIIVSLYLYPLNEGIITTMRHYFIPVRIASITKTSKNVELNLSMWVTPFCRFAQWYYCKAQVR